MPAGETRAGFSLEPNMTRHEFAKYCWEGSQRTPATFFAVRMAQAGFLPVCDVKTFENEVSRSGGYVEFVPMKPLFVFDAQL